MAELRRVGLVMDGAEPGLEWEAVHAAVGSGVDRCGRRTLDVNCFGTTDEYQSGGRRSPALDGQPDAARGHLHRSQGSHLAEVVRCDDLTDELLVSCGRAQTASRVTGRSR